MNKTYILLIHIEFLNAQGIVEDLKGRTFNSIEELETYLKKNLKNHNSFDISIDDEYIFLFDLSQFANAFNEISIPLMDY